MLGVSSVCAWVCACMCRHVRVTPPQTHPTPPMSSLCTRKLAPPSSICVPLSSPCVHGLSHPLTVPLHVLSLLPIHVLAHTVVLLSPTGLLTPVACISSLNYPLILFLHHRRVADSAFLFGPCWPCSFPAALRSAPAASSSWFHFSGPPFCFRHISFLSSSGFFVRRSPYHAPPDIPSPSR